MCKEYTHEYSVVVVVDVNVELQPFLIIYFHDIAYFYGFFVLTTFAYESLQTKKKIYMMKDEE